MSKIIGQDPIQIKKFSEVFLEHPKSAFIGRKRILLEIDSFLNAKRVKSPFLVIQGESGTGKTALMANYIRSRKKDIIHYFIKYGIIGLLDPWSFANHLYYALSTRHKLETDNTIDGISNLIESLKRRVGEISNSCLKPGSTQAIFIDALDESIIHYDLPPSDSIVGVLNSIPFDTNFRIVITTSRELPELEMLTAYGQPHRVFMKDDKREYLEDIKDYFRGNLPLKKIPNERIAKLVERSEGNFQYAVLAVEMVNKGEVDIDWLMEHPPAGLEGIYNRKLRNIRRRVSTAAWDKIWQVLKTVALLEWEKSIELICGTVGVRHSEIEDVFGPIEQFFDQALYRDQPKLCTWFHSSFQHYMMSPNRVSREEKIKSYKAVVEHIENCIRHDSGRNLPALQMQQYFDYCWKAGMKPKLNLVRHSYFAEWRTDWNSYPVLPTAVVAQGGFLEALRNNSPNDALFFGLMGYAMCHVSLDSHQYLEQRLEVLEKKLRQTSRLCDEPLSIEKEARKMAIESIRRLKQEYSKSNFKFSKSTKTAYDMLNDAFALIHKDLGDTDKAYQFCNHYANKWFPQDSDTEPEPEEKVDTVPVILNSKSDRMECRKVEEYRQNGSAEFAILIDKQNERVWYYKNLVSVNDDAYKLLCLMAEQPQGKVKYERIYYHLWKLPPGKVRKIMLDRIQKLLKRGIWKSQEELKRHIKIVQGIGVSFTEGTTVLVILKQVES